MSTSIAALLKKTEHYDKDERYMATSDLCDALKKHAQAFSARQDLPSSTSPSSSRMMVMDDSSSQQRPSLLMIDTASEQKICNAVLRLVDDSSNDVQAIAVKTLGVLVTSVHEEQVMGIACKLCELVLDEKKSALRDVYAIGLRTLVKTVPADMGDNVSSKIAAELMDGIRTRAKDIKDTAAATTAATTNDSKEERDKYKVAEEITLACLEILTDLLTRFGGLPSIARQHETMLEVTLSQLASHSLLIRKRAGNTIGCLAMAISDALLYRLVEHLLSRIDRSDAFSKSGKRKHRSVTPEESSSSSTSFSFDENLKDWKPKDTRALIRTMCSVAGVVGHRLGQAQIDRLVPIFLRFVDPSDAISGDDLYDDNSDNNDDMQDAEVEDDASVALANELRESCFAGFESFVLRRPMQIKPHLPKIIHSALAYMRHDPNYSYGDENEDEYESPDEESEDYDMDEEEEQYEDEDDEVDAVSDDDDDSWKVRRSAIRTISAVIGVSGLGLKLWSQEYSWRKNQKRKITVAGALVNRFKERDENCRVDIIECFDRLLATTIQVGSKMDVSFVSSDSMDVAESADQINLHKFTSLVVKGCERQLSSKKAGVRTKSASIALLSTLCRAPGGISIVLDAQPIFHHVKSILTDSAVVTTSGHSSNKSLKLDCLRFVHGIVSSNSYDPVRIKNGLLDVILYDLCNNMDENWYKITSETLMIFVHLPSILLKSGATEQELTRVSNALYESIEPRVAVHDADQEIKECSLSAAASLISNLDSYLSKEKSDRLFALLLQRLKNETTRLAAIRAISKIAVESASKDGVANLSSIGTEVLFELSALLRQSSRTIKQSALQCINTLVRSNIRVVELSVYGSIVKDISVNIVENDLHVSHLGLQAALSLLDLGVPCHDELRRFLVPSVLDLAKSALVQDKALDSLLCVLDKIVSLKIVPFVELLQELKSRLPSDHSPASGSRNAIANLAKCIASISSAADVNERNSLVADILLALENTANPVDSNNSQLLLRVIGDLGCLVNLSLMAGVTERLQKIYMTSFESLFEDVKNAAAYGLGRSCVRAMTVFLPMILTALEQNDQRKQYLLLTALREFIYCHQQGYGEEVGLNVDEILPHLQRHLADEEEGVRTMVAECLGCLACLQPNSILSKLKSLAEESSSNRMPIVSCTVATSMKYAIASKCDMEKTLPFMPSFLYLLREDDITVKNAALIMVYSAIHHNSDLVLCYMNDLILPFLYDFAQLYMKRQVDLGPFKQTIDDALPLRKTSLSIFASCIEKCPQVLNIPSFMPILAKALDDVEDIQLQAHQIIMTMCSRYPQNIAESSDLFVKALENTMNKKTANKTGTDLERAKEWIKSAVRVTLMISQVDGAMNNPEFSELVGRTKKNDKLVSIIQEIDMNDFQ